MAETDYSAAPPEVEDTFPGRLFLEFEQLKLRLDQENPSLSIGRDDDTDLPVKNRFVSRRHGAIEFRRGRFIYTDTSSNGTYIVDGELQVQLVRGGKTFLPAKGVIGLGYRPDKPEAAVIRFRIVDAPRPDTEDAQSSSSLPDEQ